MCVDISQSFPAIFQKGNNLYKFMFTFLENDHPKGDLLLPQWTSSCQNFKFQYKPKQWNCKYVDKRNSVNKICIYNLEYRNNKINEYKHIVKKGTSMETEIYWTFYYFILIFKNNTPSPSPSFLFHRDMKITAGKKIFIVLRISKSLRRGLWPPKMA